MQRKGMVAVMKKLIFMFVLFTLMLTLLACAGGVDFGDTSSTDESSSVSEDYSDPSSQESAYEEPFSQENSSQDESSNEQDITSEDSINESEEVSKEESKETSKETSKEESKETSKETSKEESKETSKETSKEESKETSKETSKEESKETSKEESEEESSEESSVEIKTETPKIYGCTKLYDSAFVILGTCEEGAVIYYTANGVTDFTESDNGYFSARIKSTSSSLSVILRAEVSGKASSDNFNYTAKPKSVSSGQWDIIAGKNYQFHLDYTLADYLHNNLYSQSQLDGLTQKLKNRQSSFGDTEIIYLLVPSPATIYPETMPTEYKQNGSVSRLDQVMDALNKAGIKYIDLKSLFTAHKNDKYKLYWKTDSHWTDYGAFLAYNELFSYISEKYPDAAPRAFDEFDWIEDYYVGGDMSYYLEYYMGYYTDSLLMKEYNIRREAKFVMPTQISSINRYVSNKILTYDKDTMPAKTIINTNRGTLPTAIVMRDSYSTQLYDILAERFNLTCYEPMWSFSINSNDMAKYNPDYIIYIIVERNLDSVFS